LVQPLKTDDDLKVVADDDCLTIEEKTGLYVDASSEVKITLFRK
jgi:hypothetical protein